MAEMDGLNVLVLYKAEVPRRRLDGKIGRYELIHRWLSAPDPCCVLGSETTLWMKKEIDFNRALFDQFNLF